jgi:hypothetical protein
MMMMKKMTVPKVMDGPLMYRPLMHRPKDYKIIMKMQSHHIRHHLLTCMT